MSARSAAGIILKDNKIFIALRIPGGDMGERWEFPGGKVEDGESFQETLVREYKEEFGADVNVGRHIADASFTHNGKQVELSAFEVSFTEDVQKFILSEHTETRWATLDEIKTLPFVDSDLLLYDDVADWAAAQKEARS